MYVVERETLLITICIGTDVACLCLLGTQTRALLVETKPSFNDKIRYLYPSGT